MASLGYRLADLKSSLRPVITTVEIESRKIVIIHGPFSPFVEGVEAGLIVS